MQMRERPLRGKKYRIIATGEEVTALDIIQHDMVRIILSNDRMSAVKKSELDLSIIETKDYEKIGDDDHVASSPTLSSL